MQFFLCESALPSKCRIVHKNGNRRLAQGLKKFRRRGGLGQVFGQNPCGYSPAGLEVMSQLFQTRFVSRNENEVEAISSKDFGKFMAYAGRGARDQYPVAH